VSTYELIQQFASMGIDASTLTPGVYDMMPADFLALAEQYGLDTSMLNTTYDEDTLYSWYMSSLMYDEYMSYEDYSNYTDLEEYLAYGDYMDWEEY